MKVTYYPGCSLESSARDYDESIKSGVPGPGHRPAGAQRLDLLRGHFGSQFEWKIGRRSSRPAICRRQNVWDRTCWSPAPYVITG